MTFRISLDSSIFISQLTDDVHADAVLAALTVLETMGAELTLLLLCYAELWTGVRLLPEEDRPAAETLDRVLRASQVLLVADNVVIAREAARAQAAYRQRDGRREVLIPDVIGANAAYYAGRLLTTNPSTSSGPFPPWGAHAPVLSRTVCPCATSTRWVRVSLPAGKALPSRPPPATRRSTRSPSPARAAAWKAAIVLLNEQVQVLRPQFC